MQTVVSTHSPAETGQIAVSIYVGSIVGVYTLGIHSIHSVTPKLFLRVKKMLEWYHLESNLILFL